MRALLESEAESEATEAPAETEARLATVSDMSVGEEKGCAVAAIKIAAVNIVRVKLGLRRTGRASQT